MNFVDMILHHARLTPQTLAIAIPNVSATYRQIGQGILAAERRLAEAGAKQTDLVGIAVDNPIGHMIVMCALMRLGIPTISLRGTGDGPIDRIGVTLIIKDGPAQLDTSARTMMIDDGWFSGPALASGGGRGFANAGAACRIFLSSGTTGIPKAIVCSAADIDSRARTSVIVLSVGDWERMLCMPPLTTFYGFVMVTTALSMGRSMFFAPNAAAALPMIASHRIDSIAGSTQQLQVLMDVQAQMQISCASLRQIRVGGSMLTRAYLDQVRARLCSQVFLGYGATEVGTVAYAMADRVRNVDGAAGFVVPWAEIEIVDEQGAPCRPGQDGAVRIRAEGQSPSYDLPGKPVPSNDFRDGWFYPGDRGRFTEEGILVITGRTEYVINAGGVKLAPELIEEALQSHPDIADAGALGIANAAGVEELWVAVVPRRDIPAEAIVDYMRQRDPKMVPRHVKFVPSIPRNELAKVARDTLRRQLTA